MSIRLKYHDSEIEIPNPPVGEIKILDGGTIPAISDIPSKLWHAFDNPIEKPALSKMIYTSGDIGILVSDRTRKTRLDILIPAITSYLADHGVTDSRIKIIVCVGTHTKHSPEQMEKLLGKANLEKYRVIETHQDNPDDFSSVGITPHGTRVKFHKEALNSSLLIATGAITFHYFAGFTGGRKSFLPGCAHISTIQANHRATYREENGEFVRNIACESACLDSNPLSRDMIDAYRLMPVPSFLVNVFLNPAGDIAGIYTGDVVKAHRQGCDDFKKLYALPIEKQADLVIASAGGYPTDINLLQSHKSMTNAVRTLKPGGTLFIAARCVEGFCLGKYPDFLKDHTQKELVKQLVENYEILGGTSDHLISIADYSKLYVMSGLPADMLSRYGVHPVDQNFNNWEEIYEGLSSSSVCYVMPNAQRFLPILKQ